MLVGHHHAGLVALSLLVAAAAAFVALDLAGRVLASTGRARRAWLVGGAAATGVGLFAMHYLGMLAYEPPVPVTYHLPTVLLSFVPAMLAGGSALLVLSGGPLPARTRLAAGAVIGLGIAAMHLMGMAAMQLEAGRHSDPTMVVVAIAVAVAVSSLGLRLVSPPRAATRRFSVRTLAGVIVIGLAVTATHYAGMAATDFAPRPHLAARSAADHIAGLSASSVTALTAMVLGLALLWARLDRRFGRQAAAVRASEERYRLLFNRSLAGVYQSTLDGRMLDCNDALAHMLGFGSKDDVLARGAADLYADAVDRARWIEQLVARTTLPHYEHQLKRHDGALVWVIESASLVDGVDGGPALVEGTVIDITERRDAERRLADTTRSLTSSLDRYRTLVETTNAVPWEIDARTTEWRYLSPQAERIFGYDVAAAVGRPFSWTALHHDDRDRVRSRFAALIAGPIGGTLELEYRLHRLPTGIALVRSVVVLAMDASGAAVLRGISLDISAQRQLEVELQQAQKLESVGRLAAGVAHEINTPVQFVSDSLHFVRDGALALDTLVRTYRLLIAAADAASLDRLRDRAHAAEAEADLDYLLEQMPQALALSLEGLDRVTRIVRSMKEFSHADAHAMAAIDVNHAIDSTLVVAMHEYRYVADIDLDLGDLPPVTCLGSEINQAVLNIIVNAAHAIGAAVRGTDRRGRIAIRTRRDGEHVVISIADTGGGIPEAVRSKVFEPFFTTKSVGEGSGQGLAIARAIVVDHHGGELRFDSEAGVGTTFHLRLPVVARPAARSAA